MSDKSNCGNFNIAHLELFFFNLFLLRILEVGEGEKRRGVGGGLQGRNSTSPTK